MLAFFIVLFFFHACVFLFSALLGLIRFNIDLHNFKQTFKFAGPRSKFINFLLQKSLNASPDDSMLQAALDEQSREEGDINVS